MTDTKPGRAILSYLSTSLNRSTWGAVAKRPSASLPSSLRSSRGLLSGCLAAVVLSGCVPKTQYDDQESRLQEAQAKLKSFENNSAECDPDMYLQLREQAQSLELLNQELLDRNTQLSAENSRIKSSEAQSKTEGQSCDLRMERQAREYDERLSRARATYEDLIKELRQEVVKLKATSAKPKPTKTKPTVKASPSPSPAAANP